MSILHLPRRSVRTSLPGGFGRGVLVAALTVSVTALGGVQNGYAGERHDTACGVTARAFHDQMRDLWVEHVAYTRLVIVSAGMPDFQLTSARLLQNQADIGNAFKPYFGEVAGEQLTALLRTHIVTSADILTAAKLGNTAAFNTAVSTWYTNANDIADFLHALNPDRWPDADLRAMMKEHLDLTLKEASDRLHGDVAQDIADFDQIHREILIMADTLSDGIIDAFPSRFCRDRSSAN